MTLEFPRWGSDRQKIPVIMSTTVQSSLSSNDPSDPAATMSQARTTGRLDPNVVLGLDPYLKPFIPAIMERYDNYARWKSVIDKTEGGYDAFSKGYEKYGINVTSDGTIVYREWAPNAVEAALIGDFSASTASLNRWPS